MNTGITLSRNHLRRLTALMILIVGVLLASCGPTFWSDLAAETAPKAEISVAPALYCPGEILHVEWDARPQFSDCSYGPVGPQGTAHCKAASLYSTTDPPGNSAIDYSSPSFPNLPATPVLYGSADPVAPEIPYPVSYRLYVSWPGWSWRSGLRYTWGVPERLGGERSGNHITAYARAYPYDSPDLPEGQTNRNFISVERVMVCNEDSQQWEYQPGTQTRYERYICTPEGDCTVDSWYILPGEFSIPLSACSAVIEVCGGQEGGVFFDAIGVDGGHTSFGLGRTDCSDALAGYHPSAFAGEGPMPVTTEGGDSQVMEGSPCTWGETRSNRLSRIMYRVELSPCTTPDQLVGPYATACEEALTASATEAIQSEAGPPAGDGGLVTICDLENSCGDDACTQGCEDAYTCAQDCEPSEAACPPGTYYAPVTNQCIAIQIVEPKKDNGGGDDGGGGACPAGQTWTCNLAKVPPCSCK